MAIDLSKQHELDADSKAIQQINFIGNLDQVEGKKNVFHSCRNKRNYSECD